MSTSSTHPAPGGGPRTIAGKAKSSRNALRHGCCARKGVFIDDETPEEWEALKKDCLAGYDISSPIGEQLATEVAEELWQLRRVQRQYDNVVQRLYSERPNMADWRPEDHHSFCLAQRYVTAASRSFHRAIAAIEAHERTGIMRRNQDIKERQSDSVIELNHRRAELHRAKTAELKSNLPPEAFHAPDDEEDETELFDSMEFDRRFGPASLVSNDTGPTLPADRA